MPRRWMLTALLVAALVAAVHGSGMSAPPVGTPALRPGASPAAATAEPAGVGLGEEFRLPYGEQTVVADALTIRFSSYRDERCPSDVVCEWEGNAAVRLLVTPLAGAEAGVAREVRLDTHRVVGPGTATVAEYTVRLVELLPERPGPGVTADDYVALLRVDGAGAAESSATPFPKSGA